MSEEKRYEEAKSIYSSLGVDVDAAIERVKNIPISMHCWQGDDVRGFENPDGDLTGGIQTTGNYPGRAKTIDQLRTDFSCAASLIPGKKRINLHAIYLDNKGKRIERDEIEYEHFASWVDWAKENDFGIDFNPTCFSHKLSEDGLTITHPDEKIRKFWIDHCIASRKIAERIGKELGNTVVTNYWVPDGLKDIPADRMGFRARLNESLDKIFEGGCDTENNLNSVEGKVFGIGAESFTPGSNDFYLAYAVKNGIMLTLDTGHFHPTEVVSDKISTAMIFVDDILLHVSRPVRWDSDHVVIFDDELKSIAYEIISNNLDKRVHIGLDFFDASINRIAAWIIGTRSMEKALLFAALTPYEELKRLEIEGNYTKRLALMEEIKTYPFSSVWDYYCEKCGVPVREAWLEDVKKYEDEVLLKR